jgi:hypothetical protein
MRPEQLTPLSPADKAKFDRAYEELSFNIASGQLRPNPAGIVPIHKNGGEVYDEATLQWAINRRAEAAAPNVRPSDMPFTGPSTVSARGFLGVLQANGSNYANHREDVRVRRADGSIVNVSLDMGQLAKLYEVKWRQQGHMAINAGALLAQSSAEINLANLNQLAQINNGARERTQATNQWAGIKTGKNTFRCEATETNWGQIDPSWAGRLGASVWADKKETRAWQTPGHSMCGWFEHIGEKYIATGKDTAGKIIPQYVGAAGGEHYMQKFADRMRAFSDSNQP